MNTKNISIGTLAAVVVVLGVLVLKQPTVVTVPEIQAGSAPVVNVPAPQVTVEAAKVNVPAPIVNVHVPETRTINAGSVTGPDFYYPYFAVNGVRKWYYSSAASSTSQVLCSFQLPNATTTWELASVNMSRIASSTIIEIGNATTAIATTSRMAAGTFLNTASPIALVASSTGALGVTNGILSPATYVNVKIGGGQVAGTVTPQGTCKLVVSEL